MEQKDYLLREIEKIGLIIRAIRQRLFGGADDTAIHAETQMAEVKEMLMQEMQFDLDHFLTLDSQATSLYFEMFEGFNVDNIEQLADCLAQLGSGIELNAATQCREKALQLYALCNAKSKTYSFEREAKIDNLKNIRKSMVNG